MFSSTIKNSFRKASSQRLTNSLNHGGFLQQISKSRTFHTIRPLQLPRINTIREQRYQRPLYEYNYEYPHSETEPVTWVNGKLQRPENHKTDAHLGIKITIVCSLLCIVWVFHNVTLKVDVTKLIKALQEMEKELKGEEKKSKEDQKVIKVKEDGVLATCVSWGFMAFLFGLGLGPSGLNVMPLDWVRATAMEIIEFGTGIIGFGLLWFIMVPLELLWPDFFEQ